MIEFQWPWVAVILPLPWLLRRMLRPADSPASGALRVPFYAAVAAMAKRDDSTLARHWQRMALLTLTWCLLVIAATNPRWVGDPIALPLQGRDLLLAIDVSGSMEIPDFLLEGEQVNRLAVVKATASDFIERRVGDRLGLVLFGSQAYLQTPLTFDRRTVREMLEDATIGLAGKETAIGDAIGLAAKRLRDSEAKNRTLILMTDGANTAGATDPRQAAAMAASMDVRIYTIGVGSDARRIAVPTLLGTQMINPSRDLDEKLLQDIATQTGGSYFRAKDTEGLEDIYRQLDKLEPREAESDFFRPMRALYFWPLGAALILCFAMGWPSAWRHRPSLAAVARTEVTGDKGEKRQWT